MNHYPVDAVGISDVASKIKHAFIIEIARNIDAAAINDVRLVPRRVRISFVAAVRKTRQIGTKNGMKLRFPKTTLSSRTLKFLPFASARTMADDPAVVHHVQS